MGSGLDEVVGPDVVPPTWPEPDAGPVVEPLTHSTWHIVEDSWAPDGVPKLEDIQAPRHGLPMVEAGFRFLGVALGDRVDQQI